MRKALGLCAIFVLLAGSSAIGQSSDPAGNNTGGIAGVVKDAAGGQPVVGASVCFVDRLGGTVTDSVGVFRLSGLTAGRYTLRFTHVAYETCLVRGINVSEGSDNSLVVVLEPKTVELKGITVTPGRFRINDADPTAEQVLSRDQIENVPQLGEDVFRSVNRLPGIASTDFAAGLSVRGGEHDEVLITLDGMSLYDPYHLKDIDGGAFGIVDMEAVESIDLMTGGFPADYGGHMSAVFDLVSRHPPADRRRLAAGLSLTNARVFSEGTHDDNKGSWLVSARRGYIDLVLKLMSDDDEIMPSYYDVFAKVQRQVSPSVVYSFSVLHAGDEFSYHESAAEGSDTLVAEWSNTYGWVTLHTQPHERVLGRTILSKGHISKRRDGKLFSGTSQLPNALVDDNASVDFTGLKSDWEWDISDRFLIRSGLEARFLNADYTYLSQNSRYQWEATPLGVIPRLTTIDTVRADLTPAGRTAGAFLSGRLNVIDPITAEAGARYDHVSYTGDDLLSPRLNVAFQLGPRAALRTGVGRFYQSQRIDGLAVLDDDQRFYPAERADHVVVGFEHTSEAGIVLRLEGFYKRYAHLRPDIRNGGASLELLPEMESDRMVVFREESTARGLEIHLKKPAGNKLTWWASYTLSRVEDQVDSMVLKNGRLLPFRGPYPSPRDQRGTLYADVCYRPHPSWRVNLAWHYHTGTPFTDSHLEAETDAEGRVWYWVEGDEPWSSRHEPFSRVDMRISRQIGIGDGRLMVFLEVVNLFNKDNLRNYDYGIETDGLGHTILVKEPDNWFGMLPTIGATYELEL